MVKKGNKVFLNRIFFILILFVVIVLLFGTSLIKETTIKEREIRSVVGGPELSPTLDASVYDNNLDFDVNFFDFFEKNIGIGLAPPTDMVPFGCDLNDGSCTVSTYRDVTCGASALSTWSDLSGQPLISNPLGFDQWTAGGQLNYSLQQVYIDQIAAWYQNATSAGLTQDTRRSYDGGHSSIRLTSSQFITASTQNSRPWLGCAFTSDKTNWGVKSQRYSDSFINMVDQNILDGLETYYASGTPSSSVYRNSDYYRYWYENNFIFAQPSLGSYLGTKNNSVDHVDATNFLTPFYLNSIGASGTDAALLQPLVFASASLPFNLKTDIMKKGMLVPTMMYLFKSNVIGDYFNPKSHVPAYTIDSETWGANNISDATNFYLGNLVNAAHDLQHIPPVARFEVISSSFSTTPVFETYYSIPPQETITPYAYFASIRNGESVNLIINLSKSWVDDTETITEYYSDILRGEGTIEYLDASKSLISITIPWMDTPTLDNYRTDILLLVKDNLYYSAPAYISIRHLQSEEAAQFNFDNADDVDNDGYFASGNDCNDNEALINPGMEEICFNNIDDDCDDDFDMDDIDCTSTSVFKFTTFGDVIQTTGNSINFQFETTTTANCFSINNPNFDITCSGILTNNTGLNLGEYPMTLSATDLFSTEISEDFFAYITNPMIIGPEELGIYDGEPGTYIITTGRAETLANEGLGNSFGLELKPDKWGSPYVQGTGSSYRATYGGYEFLEFYIKVKETGLPPLNLSLYKWPGNASNGDISNIINIEDYLPGNEIPLTFTKVSIPTADLATIDWPTLNRVERVMFNPGAGGDSYYIDEMKLTNSTPSQICGNDIIEGSEVCDDGINNGQVGFCSLTCDGPTPVNTPPTSQFTANPGSGNIPLLVLFDASTSNDIDGTIVNYSWDFGDSNVGDGITTSNSYTLAGDYSVNLTVRDNEGAIGESFVTITATVPSVCGNDIIEFGEICDDGILNGEPNQCDLTCSGITPSVCGNVVIEAGEFCDDGITFNGQPNQCSLSCDGITPSVCSNDVIEAGESCDDGNTIPGDGCNSVCQVEGGTIPISSCSTINFPGNYILVNDSIVNYPSTCISINASNVIFNCQGNTIDGTTGWLDYGIEVLGTQQNIVIQNCIITDWDGPINAAGMSDSQIINTSVARVRTNSDYGIIVGNSNLISNVDIALSDSGRGLGVAQFNTVNDVTITCSDFTGTSGIFLAFQDNRNNFSNMVVQGCQYGVNIVHDADFNIISDSNFINNSFGLHSSSGTPASARDNLFYNNFFNNTINFNLTQGSNNFFNINLQTSTNIIGGINIGGNYWEGYSNTCTDGDSNDICDTPLNVSSNLPCPGCSGYNIDELPLSSGSTPIPICGNLNIEVGEQCDDGNNVNRDGCSSTCLIENLGEWATVKANAAPIVHLTDEFSTPYNWPLSTLGWEDSIHISRDGLNLYGTYIPTDLVAFLLNNDTIPNLFLYARGPTLGMNITFNPAGGNYLWYHGDIIYSHRNSLSENFTTWQLSDMNKSGSSEAAPYPLFTDSENVELIVFTSNNKPPTNDMDIWIIKNTTKNPSGVGGPMNDVNTLFQEDNPHIERLTSNDLVLFFDSPDLPGGRGSHDLWYSTSSDDGVSWTTPSNNISLNTAIQEHQPHLYNDEGIWYMYYSTFYTDNKLGIFRAQQLTPGDWENWINKEVVISAGSTFGVAEPSLTDNGDLSFVVAYSVPNSTTYDRFDVDAWISVGVPSVSVCGNNIIETGEFCDGNILSCGINGYAGTQTCNLQCDGFDTCTTSEFCGDDTINGPETCDDGILNGNPGQCNNSCDGTIPLSCDLTSATWSTTSTTEGTLVSLIVNGNNCDGELINFEVFEDDLVGDEPAITNPVSVSFSGSSANSIWTSEWQCDGDVGELCTFGEPEYYFNAILASNTTETIQSLLPLLTVSELSPTCGNNITQSGEVCDDGGSNLCSTSCTLTTCGDGVLQNPNGEGVNEICEIGNTQPCIINGYDGNVTCSLTCLGYDTCTTTEFCGDTFINGPEQCDDGPLNGQQGRCNNSCTGFVPSLCDLTSASWDRLNATEGDIVNLNVVGTNCVDENIFYLVYEDKGIFPDVIIYTFIGDSFNNPFNPNWTVIYLGNGSNSKYYFEALLESNTSEIVRSDLPDLDVAEFGNNAPISQFTANPGSGNIPLTVSFDANASSDSDGTIVSYAWDFGDNTNGNGITTSHTFTLEGLYNVSLIVRDDIGAQDISFVTIDATASPIVCGNNITEAGEQCDDGNVINGDGCDSICLIETALPPDLTVTNPESREYKNTIVPIEYSSIDGTNCYYSLRDVGRINTTCNHVGELLRSDGSPITLGPYTLTVFANNSLGSTNKTIQFNVSYSRGVLIKFNKFKDKGNPKGQTTNLDSFTNEELQNISSLIFDDASTGNIEFTENINLTQNATLITNTTNLNYTATESITSIVDIDSSINISFNRIEVNSDSVLNKPAKLTLYNITFTTPVIQKDAVDCTDCTIESYVNGELTFNVTGFSIYSAREGATTGDDGNDGDSGGGGSGGGGGGTSCQPTWNCSVWNNTIQQCGSRTCTDVNNCGNDFEKPQETIDCSITGTTPQDSYCGDGICTETSLICESDCSAFDDAKIKFGIFFWVIFGILSIVAIVVAIIIVRNIIVSNKSKNLDSL